jgi:hypothetical protein
VSNLVCCIQWWSYNAFAAPLLAPDHRVENPFGAKGSRYLLSLAEDSYWWQCQEAVAVADI